MCADNTKHSTGLSICFVLWSLLYEACETNNEDGKGRFFFFPRSNRRSHFHISWVDIFQMIVHIKQICQIVTMVKIYG
jgi:hypothetical protein